MELPQGFTWKSQGDKEKDTALENSSIYEENAEN